MNPYDVFPRRNLPEDAEPWGRAIEEKIVALEQGSLGTATNLKSDGRAAAASSASLAKQLVRLDQLYLSIPLFEQKTSESTSFGVGVGWTTVHSRTIPAVPGRSTASIVAMGSLFMLASAGSLVTQRVRLVIGGDASAAFESTVDPTSGTWQAISGPQHQTVSNSGAGVTVQFQVYADDPASYPPHSSNYAVLTTLTTYTK